MFSTKLKTLALSLAIAVGGISASANTASAGTLDIDFSIDGPGIYFSSGGRHYGGYYRNHRRYYRDHRRYYGDTRYYGGPRYFDEYRRRTCKPRRAYRKARRMGIHEARIVRVNRRVIVLKGYRHGYPTKVKFGRSRSCPVIAFRRY